jgi:hypothetical protein
MANLMPRPEVSQRRKDNPMGESSRGFARPARTSANSWIVPAIFARNPLGQGCQPVGGGRCGPEPASVGIRCLPVGPAERRGQVGTRGGGMGRGT